MKRRNLVPFAIFFGLLSSFSSFVVAMAPPSKFDTPAARWEILALALSSSVAALALIAHEAAVHLDSRGIAGWRRPLLPWVSIRRVDVIRGGLPFTDGIRTIKVFYWPFESPQQVGRYVAQQLRAAGRHDLVSDWGIRPPEH